MAKSTRRLLFLAAIICSVLCSHAQDRTNNVLSLLRRADSLAYTDPQGSRRLADSAFIMATAIKNDSLIYKSRFSRGIANYTIGNMNEALDDFIKNKALAVKLNNNYRLIESLNAIGNVYKDGSQWRFALDSYREAADICRKASITSKLYLIESNVAILHTEMHNYDSSNYYCYKILREVGSSLRDINFLGNTFGTILTNYIDMGAKDSVLKYTDTVLALKRTSGDMTGYAGYLYNLGAYYYGTKDFPKAEQLLRDALAVKQDNKDLLRQVKTQLGSVLFARKKFEEAARLYWDGLVLLDSLNKAQAVEIMSEMQVKYETGKKEAELSRLSLEKERDELQLKNSRIGLLVAVFGILFFIVLAVLMFRQMKAKQKANHQLAQQNHAILEQKKEITDSINYAKRIQTAILPPERYVNSVLKRNFILYLPKDIVSGDFYWVDERHGKALFAAVDCTGHGVPGALMSVVGYNLLSQAVKEKGLTTPSEILSYLDAGVHQTLRQSQNESGIKDGMDLSLCCLHPDNTLECAGVYNSIWIVRRDFVKTFTPTHERMCFYGDHLLEIKPDKMPIGNNENDVADEFTNHRLQLQPGDYVYLYSDGFADQFGGEKGKKFKYNRLKDELVAIHHLEPAAQREHLASVFRAWKGDLEQVDDILVVGVKI